MHEKKSPLISVVALGGKLAHLIYRGAEPLLPSLRLHNVVTLFICHHVHKGMITALPVWLRHFLCVVGSLHDFIKAQRYIFPASCRCTGSPASIQGRVEPSTTVSFVATYQHWAHLFNSDLEGELRGWAEVLMLQSPSHQDCWTKEPRETLSPPRDTWIISDKAPPCPAMLLWIIYLCKGLDQLVNCSTAAFN